MEIYRDLNQYQIKKPLALSLGMFDGVHKGHQSIISKINKVAKEKNLESAILTFWPHPRLAFNPNENLKLLNTIEEKTGLLEHFSIQNLFLQDFNEDFRNLTGEEFVKNILIEKLNVKYLMVGYDHVFGKNRSGDFELLERLAPELGFEIEKLEAVNENEDTISSTKIRDLLSQGKIAQANAMLSYPFSVTGKVIDGKKIGRTIGYPTANLSTDLMKLLPKKGAYIVDVKYGEAYYKGMLSIGTNPTFDREDFTIEVHILDFNQQIYGEELTVHFREFLHDEIKFESMEKLIDRLDEDKKLTEEFFKNNPL